MPFIGTQPRAGAYSLLDSITVTATDTFNLVLDGAAYYPQSPNHLIVSLNGIIQAPVNSFTVSGSQIIFSESLLVTDTIDFILALGDVLSIGTPSANAVTTSSIQNGAVTDAKIDTMAASKLTGALPAIDGSALTGISTDLVGDTTPQLGGNLDTNNFDIKLKDGDYITLGNSDDVYVWYDPGGNNLNFLKQGGEYRFSGGAVALYYSNQRKLVTDTNGVTVTGNVDATSFSGDGSSLTNITESQITDLGSYITASSTDTLTNKSGAISQWTNDSGYLTSYTETNDLTLAVTWANVPDVNITETSVTQHEAALSITESQITDLQSYLTSISGESINSLSDVYTSMSATDGQLLTWDNANSRWDAADAPVSLPSQTGNDGKYLTTDGSTASWSDVAGAGGAIYENSTVISSNYTLTTGKNGFSVGPITVNAGVSVTIPSGQRWVVL